MSTPRIARRLAATTGFAQTLVRFLLEDPAHNQRRAPVCQARPARACGRRCATGLTFSRALCYQFAVNSFTSKRLREARRSCDTRGPAQLPDFTYAKAVFRSDPCGARIRRYPRHGVGLGVAAGRWRGRPPVAAELPPVSRATLAIVGGRLIDGFGGLPLENAVVLIDGNKTVAIGQVGGLAIPGGAKVIDADGMTILPGLWESHGHLQHIGQGRPTEFLEKFKTRLPEVMARVAEISLLAGITTFRDTGGPLAEQQALRAEIRCRTSRCSSARSFT